jgi:hypothetical protein
VHRFQFVADHQRRYGVKRLCQVIRIARSSFYHWKATAADRAARAAADSRLEARIRVIHRESGGTYGAPRITAELREDGQVVNHKRVARVMRSSGLAGLRLRRRHRTTVADPAAAKAPALLERDFTAETPNTRYVGDITYLPIADGTFWYLATVMDLCSRRLVGWAIADHMRTELVIHVQQAGGGAPGHPGYHQRGRGDEPPTQRRASHLRGGFLDPAADPLGQQGGYAAGCRPPGRPAREQRGQRGPAQGRTVLSQPHPGRRPINPISVATHARAVTPGTLHQAAAFTVRRSTRP